MNSGLVASAANQRDVGRGAVTECLSRVGRDSDSVESARSSTPSRSLPAGWAATIRCSARLAARRDRLLRFRAGDELHAARRAVDGITAHSAALHDGLMEQAPSGRPQRGTWRRRRTHRRSSRSTRRPRSGDVVAHPLERLDDVEHAVVARCRNSSPAARQHLYPRAPSRWFRGRRPCRHGGKGWLRRTAATTRSRWQSHRRNHTITGRAVEATRPDVEHEQNSTRGSPHPTAGPGGRLRRGGTA